MYNKTYIQEKYDVNEIKYYFDINTDTTKNSSSEIADSPIDSRKGLTLQDKRVINMKTVGISGKFSARCSNNSSFNTVENRIGIIVDYFEDALAKQKIYTVCRKGSLYENMMLNKVSLKFGEYCSTVEVSLSFIEVVIIGVKNLEEHKIILQEEQENKVVEVISVDDSDICWVRTEEEIDISSDPDWEELIYYNNNPYKIDDGIQVSYSYVNIKNPKVYATWTEDNIYITLQDNNVKGFWEFNSSLKYNISINLKDKNAKTVHSIESRYIEFKYHKEVIAIPMLTASDKSAIDNAYAVEIVISKPIVYEDKLNIKWDPVADYSSGYRGNVRSWSTSKNSKIVTTNEDEWKRKNEAGDPSILIDNTKTIVITKELGVI